MTSTERPPCDAGKVRGMCDTVVVQTDTGILFAKNSDRDPNEAQLINWYAAADHPDGATVACTGMTIPQVAHTHAIAIARPWWLWGAEMGANEHGVVIGNEGVFNRRGHAKEGLLGMDLVRLALERADDAERAVSVLVDLLEAYGQGGSHSHDHPGFRYDNSFLVADPNGAIVLETARRDWATEPVTGRVRSISNGYTIAAFGRAHADPLRARVAQCTDRRCLTEAAGEVATGPADLFAAMRSHGGSSGPRFHVLNGALGAPCVHPGGIATASQTAGSWVADLRDAHHPLHWVTATAAPCTSIYKPLRVDEPADTGDAAEATNHFDDRVGWWRHELVHRASMRDHTASLARFAGQRDRLEASWLVEPPETADAFATARVLETAWIDDLLAARLPDTRPKWLRRIATKTDAAAGLTWPYPRPEAESAVTGIRQDAA